MSTSSEEDYLRAIYEINLTHDAVRSVDVARALDVSKPSVNKARAKLQDLGYVSNTEYGPITLTERGRVRGAELHERYELVKRFLRDVLGVQEETASEEAHGIEHAISDDTAVKFKDFLNQLGDTAHEHGSH